MVIFCERCIIPKGFKEYTFVKHKGRTLCSSCYDLETHPDFPNMFGPNNLFVNQLQNYLDRKEKILFAYSGGLDSLVTLAKLIGECKKRSTELVTFTIDHGFKGKQTKENIKKTLNYFGIMKNHIFINKKDKVFSEYYNKTILPCGKVCNQIMDSVYKEIMEKTGINELVTGGDTPKVDKNGKYSIFWRKKSGVLIVRGACGFNLNKDYNSKYIKDNNLPWKNPFCGGYDTDCLLPGAILYNMLKGNPNITIDRTMKDFPILIDFFSERVRFKIIKREKALESLKRIEISSPNCLKEIRELVKQQNL